MGIYFHASLTAVYKNGAQVGLYLQEALTRTFHNILGLLKWLSDSYVNAYSPCLKIKSNLLAFTAAEVFISPSVSSSASCLSLSYSASSINCAAATEAKTRTSSFGAFQNSDSLTDTYAFIHSLSLILSLVTQSRTVISILLLMTTFLEFASAASCLEANSSCTAGSYCNGSYSVAGATNCIV